MKKKTGRKFRPNKVQWLTSYTVRVYLTQGKHTDIDSVTYEKMKGNRWYAANFKNGNKWYAVTWQKGANGKNTMLHLHTFLMKDQIEAMKALYPGKKIVVNHIDNDGLNNRLFNLEVTENKNNVRAQRKKPYHAKKHSEYRGVHRQGRGVSKSFYSMICVDMKRLYLGSFKQNEEAAARAYDEAAKKYFGKYAVLNFPEARDFEIMGHVSNRRAA